MSTETKYGKYISPTQKWTSRTGVEISDHIIKDRWDERTPGDAVSPEYAWEHGIIVPRRFYGVFRDTDKSNRIPREVRTWREDEDTCSERYQVCLVARGARTDFWTVTTVIPVKTMPSPERAYLRELWFAHGGPQ